LTQDRTTVSTDNNEPILLRVCVLDNRYIGIGDIDDLAPDLASLSVNKKNIVNTLF